MASPAEAWNLQFTGRRRMLYKGESTKPFIGILSQKEITSEFLSHNRSALGPPGHDLYAALQRFFDFGALNDVRAGVVLLDDRCDTTAGSGVTVTRIWDSEGEKGERNGYLLYPPLGENVFRQRVTLRELESRLVQDVMLHLNRLALQNFCANRKQRLSLGAEKRTMYDIPHSLLSNPDNSSQ